MGEAYRRCLSVPNLWGTRRARGPPGWLARLVGVACVHRSCVSHLWSRCLYRHTGTPPTNRALLPATTVALREDGGVVWSSDGAPFAHPPVCRVCSRLCVSNKFRTTG